MDQEQEAWTGVLLASLRTENTRLWEIVRAVAEDDPYCYNDNNGKMECLYCYDSWEWAANDKHTKNHDPDCLISKARALVEQAKTGEEHA